MPVPVRCGANAHCLGDSTCVCNEVKARLLLVRITFYQGLLWKCLYRLSIRLMPRESVFCWVTMQSSQWTVWMSWRLCFDQRCLPITTLVSFKGFLVSKNFSPLEPIIATENQYGYAMGYLQSPFYGSEDYPTNFDCEYLVTAPRTDGHGSLLTRNIYSSHL